MRPQKLGGPQGTHAMVAIDYHSALGVRREPDHNFREGAQRKPFMAIDPAEHEFVALAAVDQAWSLIGGQVNPLCNRAGADFKRELGIRKRWKFTNHSTITGVPTSTFSKNFSDIWCGMRMQPWDAA